MHCIANQPISPADARKVFNGPIAAIESDYQAEISKPADLKKCAKKFDPCSVLLQCSPAPLSEKTKLTTSDGLAVYRTVMPQSVCSLQRGFYSQPIILEFSFQQYIPHHRSKPASIFVRWKKDEKKKVRHADGSLYEYPVMAFYTCVNRDLANKGTFRQAHHAVGAVVALAEQSKKPLNKLSREQLVSVNEKFDSNSLGVFDLKFAMARRNLVGAPGTKEVAKQLAKWSNVL